MVVFLQKMLCGAWAESKRCISAYSQNLSILTSCM